MVGSSQLCFVCVCGGVVFGLGFLFLFLFYLRQDFSA